MKRLDILDHLLLEHTAYHRRADAWDLLDEDGRVVAVLFPRKKWVSVAVLDKPVPRADPKKLNPYGATVSYRVSDNPEDLATADEAEAVVDVGTGAERLRALRNR